MLTDYSADATKKTMNQFSIALKLFLSVIFFIIFNASLQASQDTPTFTPPEVAIGTFSCKAEWNQFCEDQKTIKVPEGHKLCKNTITVKEQMGDSSYEIVSTDSQGVTVKFHAKGNRDRIKQQGASIIFNISLLGVRENVDCISGAMKKPSVAINPAPEPKAAVIAEKITETKIEAKPAEATTLAPAPIVSPTTAITQEQKPHACACSQWIDADKVFNCLANGHGRDNVKCDSFSTTIQCVASKEECHESQKENCPQIAGLNQTTSKKRIFVLNSPYCHQP